MQSEPDDFSGSVFHASLSGGRAGARLRLAADALQAETSGGERFRLAYADCRLEIGGASGHMLFCRDAARSLTIACDDRRFGPALRAAAGGRLDEQLAAAGASARAREAGSRRLMLGLSVAALLLLVVGGWGLVAAGRGLLGAAPPELDRQLGDLAFEQMTLEGPVVEDLAVTRPLEALLARLAAVDPADPFDYRLAVVDAEVTNAFALPGGRIVVYTGLLETAATPEQVAGVLAHEIAHITERHGMRRIARTVGLLLAVQLLLGDAGGLVTLGGEIARRAAENAYSRDEEADSDRLGVERLHAAGIDPGGLGGFFALLHQHADGAPQLPEWFSTHPDHAARVAALQAQVAALPPRAYEPAIPAEDWAALRAALGAPLPDPVPQTLPEETSDGRDDR